MVQESGEAHMTDAPKKIWAWSDFAQSLAGTWGVTRYPSYSHEYILAAEHERLLSEARNKALEDAARAAERDCDWTAFGKAGIEEWDGGPDGVRDYRLGIRAGRAIAAAIRALRESPDA
jgi:hypothetical protein